MVRTLILTSFVALISLGANRCNLENQLEPETFCQKTATLNQKTPDLKNKFKAPAGWQEIKRVFIVILENTDSKDALSQPFLSNLAKNGAYLSNSFAVTHPSQPNYIALISGGTQGVVNNDNVRLNVPHIGDLLKSKGKKWKLYAEDFPGDCFQGMRSGSYARRHVPFLSFTNVTQSKLECANVVNARQLDVDIQNKTLPDYSFYVPNNSNNGHDTGINYADKWMTQKFTNLLKQKEFIDGTLFIVTFDESGGTPQPNQIYTVLYGAGVQPGTISNQCYDHYSLLGTTEKILDLETLGKNDSQATLIDDVWKIDATK